jgi:HEAT repeat protein
MKNPWNILKNRVCFLPGRNGLAIPVRVDYGGNMAVFRAKSFGEALMLNKKIICLILVIGFSAAPVIYAQTVNNTKVEENFNDFLHYLMIGRFDLAKGFAKAVLDSNSAPAVLFDLSTKNQQGMKLLQKAKENTFDAELAELSGQILALINKGIYIQRYDPQVIVEEVKRLSTTPRGFLTAVQRLRDAGEYSIMYMIDALTDPSRQSEWPKIIEALPKIGRDAIRPLTTALQMEETAVKAEIIKALGEIEYPQSLAYLKYVVEEESSQQLRELARESIKKIDPSALDISAAQLFYTLGENYYYHAQSLQPVMQADFANIWFWDKANKQLTKAEVDSRYFNELMAMRCCEWSLKANANFGEAIGLWLAAFFKAESTGVEMPVYFGENHPDAFVYATTAGPEYIHQALARALKDNDSYVALAAVEAMANVAGEKSLPYKLAVAQPLILALSYKDRAVKYSAAIAIASAGPVQEFEESKLVTKNLAEALGQNRQADVGDQSWTQQLADSYAVRAAAAMLKLVQTRNTVVDLSAAEPDLIKATRDKRQQIKILSGQVLAYLKSPNAQSAIADMAVDRANSKEVRIAAFNSLATSAKINANLLENNSIDAIYSVLSSREIDPELRNAAASAFGSLNLPSRKVKDLILDRSKS